MNATDEVDVVVVGSGTGLAAALAAHDAGLTTLVIEKTDLVGGSTARSGGAFWIPANPILDELGAVDTPERGARYLDAVVGDSAPLARRVAFAEHGPATVRFLQRVTRLKFTWAKGYSDYHPELPGGSAQGRSCEARPFDLNKLGDALPRLRPGVVEAPVPMPVTGGDYKWLNLMNRKPARALPVIAKRVAQGIGGMALRRRYAAGGQALAAGLFDAAVRAGIPIRTGTALRRLLTEDGRVTAVEVEKDDTISQIRVRRGVVLAAGGFDHDLAWRRRYQSPALQGWSLGAEGNTGDAIKAAVELGAATTLMDQAWWFPAIAPLPDAAPSVMLAERSLPGSFMIDRHGRRFANESADYMTFGQQILARERAGDPVGDMWMVFDQGYRNGYVLGGSVFPRMALPQSWYDNGIAVRGKSFDELAAGMGVPVDEFVRTGERFNELAGVGEDEDFGRGNSAYDRYYGDPTVTPNPNLRPLDPGRLFAIRVVLSDLGTCGGLVADEHARVLDAAGAPIPGLYAIGNTAGNAFGTTYPGAGATIGQGLVYGYIAARHLVGADQALAPAR